MGKVLNVYWHFGDTGDCYLGRVLAGLDPNGDKFDVLPAHWITDEPTANEDIMEGLNCCFSTILQKWGTTDKNPSLFFY